jgi:hypothetical protein
VLPDAGAVMATVGGAQSPVLDTVTVTGLEVVLFPAASSARAVRVCEPVLAVVVFQETEYGALVSWAPRLPPSSLNWTPATPTLSDASAVTVIVPQTVDPEAGNVMLIVGGVVSAVPLETVTATPLEMAELPAASRACAVSVCEPLLAAVVSQEIEYGALVSSPPTLTPSSLNWTPTTPALSEAVAVTGIVPETFEPDEGDVMLTVGGEVSETVIVTALDVVAFPAASRARAVNEWEPGLAAVVFHETEYGAVVSSAPRLAPSSMTWTPATPALSEAVAVTLIVPETVAPDVGDVMLTVGGVVSETVTVTALDVVAFPAASRARAVKVWEPGRAVVVFHESEYGALVSSALRLPPSSMNWTPATPTLSAAFAVTLIVPETVDPGAGDVMLTVGGVVSGGGPLETVTVTAAEVVAFPAASRARAVRVCVPLLAVVVSHGIE